MVRVRSGHVWYDDEDIVGLSQIELLRRGISFVPQGRNVFPRMSVRANLELGGVSLGNLALTRERVTGIAFELFPILHTKADRQAGTLSGGEQKMLEIGRAMLLEPRLLLIDEPSVGLSPILVQQVFGVLQQLRDRGTTVLMIEQNAKSALEVSDYGLVLQQGRLALAGTASDVLNHPEIGRLFLGGAMRGVGPRTRRPATAQRRDDGIRFTDAAMEAAPSNRGVIPTGTTALFTIIGSPVVQVVAPRIFNEHFAEHGHDAVLVAFDLDPDAVGAFFDAMRRTANFGGSFVTVPHKREATRHMDELTPRSSALGVVNAVKHVDGRLVGDLTDGMAFLAAARSHGFEPAGARVAMIGGGGTATAIAARVRRARRRRTRAECPRTPHDTTTCDASSRRCRTRRWSSFDLDSLEGFDLVINATTVGMNGDPNVPHPVDILDSRSLVGEVVDASTRHTMAGSRTRSRLPHPTRRRHGGGTTRTRRPMVGTRRHLGRLTRRLRLTTPHPLVGQPG